MEFRVGDLVEIVNPKIAQGEIGIICEVGARVVPADDLLPEIHIPGQVRVEMPWEPSGKFTGDLSSIRNIYEAWVEFSGEHEPCRLWLSPNDVRLKERA